MKPLKSNFWVNQKRFCRGLGTSGDRRGLEGRVFQLIEKTLPEKRLNHVKGVVALAEKLAVRHRVNVQRARLAAVLHDVARCWSDKALVEYARKRRLKVPEFKSICAQSPVLLHSYVGADLAKRLFGVKDGELLSAIAKHSLGSVRMTRFEKLVYLADLLAPDRIFPEAISMRTLAMKDLDRAFLEGLRCKMIYVLRRNQPLHPHAVEIWNRHSSSGKGPR